MAISSAKLPRSGRGRSFRVEKPQQHGNVTRAVMSPGPHWTLGESSWLVEAEQRCQSTNPRQSLTFELASQATRVPGATVDSPDRPPTPRYFTSPRCHRRSLFQLHP
ncbi:hypothetical protein VTJ04DRAFT_4784 [Mycothermus thermophilus]|uniref:uncharacterized protein n=1 Tax=Humicola insolens TaxID=85995 RepID=UPI003743AC51